MTHIQRAVDRLKHELKDAARYDLEAVSTNSYDQDCPSETTAQRETRHHRHHKRRHCSHLHIDQRDGDCAAPHVG